MEGGWRHLNVQDFFNDRAAVWDQNAILDETNIRTMLHLCDIRPGCHILDVGCGTGGLEPFLEEYSPGRVLAIDFAEKMIGAANGKPSFAAVEFRCIDFFHLWSEKFDLILFLSTFPHFPEPDRAVTHAAALLKPGGRLAISHAQGKSGDAEWQRTPPLPAQGLVKLMQPFFRLDVLVDNPAMFMVSGTRIRGKKPNN